MAISVLTVKVTKNTNKTLRYSFMSAFIIIKVDSLIPHRTQNLYKKSANKKKNPTQTSKQDLVKTAASRLRPRLDAPSHKAGATGEHGMHPAGAIANPLRNFNSQIHLLSFRRISPHFTSVFHMNIIFFHFLHITAINMQNSFRIIRGIWIRNMDHARAGGQGETASGPP